MNIGLQVLIVGALFSSLIIAFFYYVFWPFFGLSMEQIPPHLLFLIFTGINWLGNIISGILFFTYARRSKGGR